MSVAVLGGTFEIAGLAAPVTCRWSPGRPRPALLATAGTAVSPVDYEGSPLVAFLAFSCLSVARQTSSTRDELCDLESVFRAEHFSTEALHAELVSQLDCSPRL